MDTMEHVRNNITNKCDGIQFKEVVQQLVHIMDDS